MRIRVADAVHFEVSTNGAEFLERGVHPLRGHLASAPVFFGLFGPGAIPTQGSLRSVRLTRGACVDACLPLLEDDFDGAVPPLVSDADVLSGVDGGQLVMALPPGDGGLHHGTAEVLRDKDLRGVDVTVLSTVELTGGTYLTSTPADRVAFERIEIVKTSCR